MSRYLKVEGHQSLVRDTNSGAIVNSSVSEYEVYMKRVRSREEQGDQIRNAVKEINGQIGFMCFGTGPPEIISCTSFATSVNSK